MRQDYSFYDAVTDFIFMEDEPRRSDVIFLPGNNRPDCALRVAELYREGYADYVLPSGKYSKLAGRFIRNYTDTHSTPSDLYDADVRNAVPDPDIGMNIDVSTSRANSVNASVPDTEWSYLSGILLAHGVPAERILREDRATFTWENAIFSRQVLDAQKIPVRTAILCCQAFHARRAWMYYKQQFPESEILVVPVNTRDITRDNWYLSKDKTDVVLGEVSRIGEQFHCCLPLL